MQQIAHAQIVSIIAGGWSLRGLNPHSAPGHMIGVNESGVLLDVDDVVSMDRLWTESRWNKLKSQAKRTWVRKNCLINIEERPEWLMIYENERIPSMDGVNLNGTNSGMVAMNLAWRMKPKKLYLFGFDMCRSPLGSPYWHDPYPWAPGGGTKPGKYDEWSKQFDTVASAFAAIGTDVVNCSLVSKIESFKKEDPRCILT